MAEQPGDTSIDPTLNTTQRDHSVVSGFTSSQSFEDEIDAETEITNKEAFWLLTRGLFLIRYARGLFFTKWGMSFFMVIPPLFLGWTGKIIVDHVILAQPVDLETVNFPPHMYWFLELLVNMGRMEIVLAITILTFVLLFLIGTRVGDTRVELNEGTDNASRAENQISQGGSAAGGIFGTIEFWIDVRLTQRIVNGVRRNLFSRLLRSNMVTIDNQRVGDRLYRVLYDTPMLYTCVTELTFVPFFLVVTTGLVLYQISYTYGHLAEVSHILISATLLPIVAIVSVPLSKYVRRISQNMRAAGAATTSAMEETLDNITAVQSLGGMQKEKERFARRSAHSYWRDRLNIIVWVGIGIVIAVAEWPIVFYMMWLVTNLVIEGHMTVGDYAALYGLYAALRGSFNAFGRLWINLQDQAAAARRIFFYIDYPTEEDHRDPQKRLAPVAKDIELEDVSFTYPEGRQALKSVSLRLPLNQVIAIVGPTGSGKTTLAYLLPGFISPTSGKVRMDGTDVEDVNLEDLRSQVAYIFQEHLLFSESIRANLQIANPDATDEEMERVLRIAGCSEFIAELPDGIDTVLGRSGDTLSVGQQQRLCIARGLIQDAKVIILDEPTAALDPQTENVLVDSLRQVAEDRIVVIIAHRLSTIRKADQIVFLEDGEVKDFGPHDELMSRENSPYRRYVDLQTV